MLARKPSVSVCCWLLCLLLVSGLLPAPAAFAAAPPGYTYKTYKESTDHIVNPERGFMYLFSPTDRAYTADQVRAKGYSVAFWHIKLEKFRKDPFSSSFLTQLDEQFQSVRSAGIKVVLRFSYSDDGNDAPQSVVLGHIAQLKPLLHKYADVILVMQAGFVGAWGEWHSSDNGLHTAEQGRPIMDALLDALPSNRMLQIRTPMLKEMLYPNNNVPLQPDEAFTNSARARIGHHNDCFVSSSNDVGTYASNAIEGWKEYVSTETQYTPHGGETCRLSSSNDSSKAIAEMELMHTSYLSEMYHPDVYRKWKKDGSFDEISQRLGYRLVLDNASWNEQFHAGQSANLILQLRNTGFASMFNERTVYAVLDNGKERYNIPLPDVDPRDWAGGEQTTVNTVFHIPAHVPPGSYNLALWLPDAAETIQNRTEYAVQLANNNMWDARNGYNVLADQVTVVSSAAPNNHAPVAEDSSLYTIANTAVYGMLVAHDPDADPLMFHIVNNGKKGTASITNTATGAFTYLPKEGQTGTDTFTFRATDGKSYSTTMTVTISIAAPRPNQAPVSNPLSVTTQVYTAISGMLPGYDPDGDPVTYMIVKNGQKGSATITNDATGAFTYAPKSGQTGTDTFTFRVYDGKTYSATATVTVTIQSAAPPTPPPSGGWGGPILPSDQTSTNGKLTIPVGGRGTVKLGDDITVVVPAGAADVEQRYAIEKHAAAAVPANAKHTLVSSAYTITNDLSIPLQQPVTLSLRFNEKAVPAKQQPTLFMLDPAEQMWEPVASKAEKQQLTAEVKQLGTYAIYAVDQTVTPVVPLTDIDGHWAEKTVREAVSKGIVQGYADGSYQPDANITRTEFVTLLTRALQLPAAAWNKVSFTDRDSIASWARQPIAQAVQAGIIQGDEAGRFNPNELLTRAEMVVMIARASQLKLNSASSTSFADDAQIPSWAKPYVAAARQAKLVDGMEGNRFVPSATATRAEAAVLALRLFQAQETND